MTDHPGTFPSAVSSVSPTSPVRFDVSHTTVYRYSRPVSLGPQTLRFRPRDGAGQRCVAHTLSIDPAPIGRTEDLDAEGNPTEIVWFDGETDRLRVSALLTVDVVRDNPFDFLVQATEMPVDYGEEAPLLAASLTRADPPEGDPVAAFAAEVAADHADPAGFLTALTHAIHERCPSRYRESGEPFTPAEVLDGGGACRDLAVLFIDAARSRGLACRFVSGYTTPPQKEGSGGGDPELHAWAEVYLPGGGWRAFDPTRGLAVADRHVTVTASADPQFCMPITGLFGGDATTEIDFTLDVTLSETPAHQRTARQQVAQAQQ